MYFIASINFIYLVIVYKIHTIWSLYIIYIFEFAFKHTLTSFIFITTHFSRSYSSSSSTSSSMFSCVSYFTLNLSFSCRIISLTACWKIALLSCCLPTFFLNTVSCLCYLVGVEARHATVKLLLLIYGRLDERALRVGKLISSSARSQAFYSSIVCTSTL